MHSASPNSILIALDGYHAPVANMTLPDGTQIRLNLARHWRKPVTSEPTGPTPEQRRQLFNNIVTLSNRHVPLQHIHPRTARVEAFKEMMAKEEIAK